MPTRSDSWPAGTPCWVDLSTPDIDAAQAFYTALLGWTYQGGEPEYGGYLTAYLGEHTTAGLVPRMDPSQPSAWSLYFATDDADKAATAISEAGGTIVAPPMDVGPMGRMALALDPTGSFFGLWQAGEHKGAGLYNEPGGLVWEQLETADLAAAQAFYASVFGFRYDGMGEGSTFALSGDALGGMHPASDPQATDWPGWQVFFACADTDACIAATTAAGGTLVGGPNDTEWGRMAFLADPWGARFAVMGPPAAG